ncbi:MAG: energy transducer TonB [Chitinispirillales bacterium]|jgi:outer membrane biosynthesis protein TonB|nr:energy transducer TonB [Chitinispirillales bacterium]
MGGGGKERANSSADRLFAVIQPLTILLFFTIGAALYRMGTGDILLESRQPTEAIVASFVMEEPRPQPPQPPRPQDRERRIEPPVEQTTREPAMEEPPPRPPRQVYGLRRVFSQGLGANGSSGDAIVGRLGNTLNANADTAAAVPDDLRPQPVAQPTIPPRLQSRFRRLRPQYSQEMLQNRVEGTVRARLLVGTDGNVRRVEITEDIGYDSAEIATDFLMTLQFEPATRGGEPVSVWIPFSIRFELI